MVEQGQERIVISSVFHFSGHWVVRPKVDSFDRNFWLWLQAATERKTRKNMKKHAIVVVPFYSNIFGQGCPRCGRRFVADEEGQDDEREDCCRCFIRFLFLFRRSVVSIFHIRAIFRRARRVIKQNRRWRNIALGWWNWWPNHCRDCLGFMVMKLFYFTRGLGFG